MRKLISTAIMLLLSLGTLMAQRTITGRVVDDKGDPVENASIAIKGTKLGTVSGADGRFSIVVPANGKVLIFSAIGLVNKEVPVENSRNLLVTLTVDRNISLDNVVVVGYGSAQKASTVVGSVSQIQSKEMEEKPSADVMDALQGKVPGLMILSSSGEPSSQASVNLNGIGSLSSDVTPLFVLDGMPVAQATIIALDPNDFESMTVLRDASATSIYGARAANGVIYITTKHGQAGTSVIDVRTQYGVSNLSDVKFFKQFMNSDQLSNFWVATGYHTQGYVDTLLQQYPNNTAWYKYYYKHNPPSGQLDVSISGGSAKTTYFVSGSYYGGDGVAFSSNFDRYTFRSNITTKVNNWLNLGVDLSGGYNTYQTNPNGSNNIDRGLFYLAQPWYTPIDPTTGKAYPTLIPGWGAYNPQYLANQIVNPYNTTQLDPTGYLEFMPIHGLTVTSRAGLDAYDQRQSYIQYPSFQGSPNDGSSSESFARYTNETFNNTAEYKFSIRKQNNFTALVGQEYIDNKQSNFSGSSTGQTDNRLVLLGDGPNDIAASSDKSEYTYISYFARLDYNYKEKYYLDVSGRQDGSSLFGTNVRTAEFGSVGLLWQAKKEPFLQDVSWLTDLQIRANTGTSGNSAFGGSYYQALPTVSNLTYNGETGWDINNAGDPNLTWEKVHQTTFGAIFNLFNMAAFDVSYYRKVTSSMLVNVPYPYTSGFSALNENVGSLQNSGVDARIDLHIIKTRKASLTPYFTIGYNKEKVTKLFEGLKYWVVPNTGVCWVIGKPVTFFEPEFYQVNPQTGNAEWYVPNADPNKIVYPNFDKNNVTTNFDPDALQQSTGIKVDPPLTGGFGLAGTLYGFALDVNFAFVEGKHIINNDEYFYNNPNVFTGYNQSADVLNYWKQPGDVTRFPSYNVQFTQFDSRLIENANFLRMKTLTLSYNIPKSVLERTKAIRGLKLYVTGRNLLTFTKYPGVDPEVNSNLELGSYPNTKQLAAGVDFQF